MLASTLPFMSVTRKRLSVLVLAILSMVSASLVMGRPALATAPGDSTVFVSTSGGQLRTALLHVPPSAGANPPLVVVLHALTGSSYEARNDYHWNTVADTDGFIVSYPDGEGMSWNAGTCCSYAMYAGVDDVRFLDELVTTLISQGTITASSPIYAAGMSNGGMMVYRWACQGNTPLTGLGLVAASLQVPAAACSSPKGTRIVAVHGDADHNVPEDGNSANATYQSGEAIVSVNASLKPFLSVRGCDVSNAPAGVPSYNTPYPTSTVVTGAVTRGRWDPCTSAGTLAEKFVIAGGGHSWPCGEPLGYETPSTDMSATLTLVQEWGLDTTGTGTPGTPVPCNTTTRV